MNLVQLLFYAFASVAVLSGMMVVSSKNPVRGVLFLVLTFVSTAGLWLLLQAEFLALVLVLVYVGAVMTLFLFVVMMLSVNRIGVQEGFVRYLPLAGLIVLMMLGVMFVAVGSQHFGLGVIAQPEPHAADYSNIATLGSLLYTDYVFPFEVSAVLLLTAIIAAISLTHRKATKRKSQNVEAQVAVKSADRVRLVDMPTEPRVGREGDAS